MAITEIADERPGRCRRVTGTTKRETSRINPRVPRKRLQLIDKAAEVAGKSRTDFTLDSAQRSAIDILLDQRLFLLEPKQYDAFVKALDNPPEPDAKLIARMGKKPLWQRQRQSANCQRRRTSMPAAMTSAASIAAIRT